MHWRGCAGERLLFQLVLLLITVALLRAIRVARRIVRARAATFFNNFLPPRAVADEATRHAKYLRPEHCENAERENKT